MRFAHFLRGQAAAAEFFRTSVSGARAASNPHTIEQSKRALPRELATGRVGRKLSSNSAKSKALWMATGLAAKAKLAPWHLMRRLVGKTAQNID